MKHLSHKLAVSLLATSVTLSPANADHPLLEVPSVVSYNHIINDPAAFVNTKSPLRRLIGSKPHQTPQKESLSIIQNLSHIQSRWEAALLLGSAAKDDAIAAQEELMALTKLYNHLKSEFDILSEEAQQLKIANAVLTLELEEHKAEKLSNWQRIKNWLFKLDATKVTTTAITGLITIISTLLVILL